MALDPLSCANDLTDAIAKACGHGSDGLPDPDKSADPSTFPSDFASAYDNYAKEGFVLGAENEGGNAGALESFLSGLSQPGGSVTDFAQAIADFWTDLALIPGEPFNGERSVVSIINNAPSLVGSFESAIRASFTTEKKGPPYYLHFIENIENVVKDEMIWTVTQRDDDGRTTDYMVGIDQGEL